MNENGEIVAGATGVGAMLAGFWAAWKSFKPAPAPEKTEVGMLTARVEKLETAVVLLTEQQRRAEQDREDANEVRGQIFEQIRLTRESVARIEGRLAS